MVTGYFVLEYVKVLCGYLFLMFLWPSIVFRKYLRGKSRIFWFGFCVTAQVVVVNTVVLSLGLIHSLNKWMVSVVFYGIFLWSLLKGVKFGEDKLKKAHRLLVGTYGIRIFFVEDILGGVRRLLQRLRKEIQPHLMEYLLLAIVLLYGMIYFSYGTFQNYSYGASDLTVHHSWIYGLIEGNIFSRKIYPEAMHCFVYALYVLFKIRVESILLFLPGIHIVVFLLSAYGLLREVFHWRYTAVFALEAFLVLDLKSAVMMDSMARLQWALPQEFGLYTQFLCALFLFRYLKSTHRAEYKGKKTKNCWDENLVVFMLALASSIAIHFYPTIMAFFLCIAFAVFFWKKIFSGGHFIPLVAAVLGGVVIAAAPMMGAFASGMEFHGSINWALNVMNGNKDSQETDSSEQTLTEEEDQEAEGEETDEAASENPGKMSVWEKVKTIYDYGYINMHGMERAKFFARMSLFAVLFWLIYRGTAIGFKVVVKKQIDQNCFDGYPPLVMASFLFMMIYTGTKIGIPQLIDRLRICSTTQMLMLGVAVIPIDIFISFVRIAGKERAAQAVSLLCSVGICVVTIMSGNYHGYLYFFMTRYNSAVRVTNSIINTLPQFSYTIVSTTDELYPVIEYGRHEELLTFAQKCQEENYTLPTEYVFVYVEKKPFSYSYPRWIQGPSWLALEKYAVNSQIITMEISEEYAERDIMRFPNEFRSYTHIESRTILESRAYEWCQRFQELYPYEMNVYYEDDDFVCYFFRQEPNAPYNLAIGSS